MIANERSPEWPFIIRGKMERELQRLTWTKVKNLVPDSINTILIPVGTTEAHGSAALGTDNFIPEAIARDQAERLNALIAPTLSYGITKSLYGYPGSITIRSESYTPFIIDILKSFLDHKFKNIIILNGHGGNNKALKEAAYHVHYRRQAFVAVVHWWDLVSDLTREHFGQDGGHAGINETACVQAIDPALADKREYQDVMAYEMTGGADVYPSPGSVMLYTRGEGYPDFDLKQAKAYFPKVCRAVGDFIQSIMERWQQLNN